MPFKSQILDPMLTLLTASDVSSGPDLTDQCQDKLNTQVLLETVPLHKTSLAFNSIT